MARKRNQQGQLIEEFDRYSYRWREYYINAATGKEKSRRKRDVLISKPCTREEALRLLAEKMHVVNHESRFAAPNRSVKPVRQRACLALKEDYFIERLSQRVAEKILPKLNSAIYSPEIKPGNFKPLSIATFAGFADKWKRDVMKHHEESTQELETRYIEKTLKPAFGQYQMQEITAETVQTWASGIRLGPKTIGNYVSTFKLMWKTAKTWGYVQHDPFEGLRLASFGAGNVYQFSAEEMKAIIHEAKGRYKLFLELLAKTGMRPGEAAGLRPEDLEGRLLKIRQTVYMGKIRPRKTKTKDSIRSFTISDQLAEKIRQHIAETGPNRHGLIFLNKDGCPINMDHFNQKILRTILERLGIWEQIKSSGVTRCGSYAFRHGVATELSRLAVPLKTIQERLGHSSGSEVTMQHYIHPASADDLKAADLMETLLSPKDEVKAAPATLGAIHMLLCDSCRDRIAAALQAKSG